MDVRIALVQFARQKHAKEENVERMINHLDELNEVDLVCLPENWFGVEPLSEEDFDDIISKLSSIASEKNVNLLTGAGYMWQGDAIYDSCYVINDEGKVLGHSDKMFPSKSVGETEFLSAGENFTVFNLDGLKIGVVVCIDAVYPEVSRKLASEGAEIIFNPSNIPQNRLEMWKSIGVTRAVENGVFFSFINNTSTNYPDGRNVTGHSFAVSPEGEMVVESGEAEQVLEFGVDLSEIDHFRTRWGFLEKANQKIR